MTKQQQTTSRYFAIDILANLEKTKLPVSLLIAKQTSITPLSGRDRHLAINLIYGVLRQRQYLDSLLQSLCRQPLRKLPTFIHQALAVGLYQIFFLDRIPESAAVNESVNAVKKARTPKRYHGLVNGVLRESIRQRHTLPFPDGPDSKGEPVLNHPTWLTDRWQKKYGKETLKEICQKNNAQPPLVVRVNRRKHSRDSLLHLFLESEKAQEAPFSPDGLILPEYSGPITELPGYENGFFQVQDEAAQLASHLLQPFVQNGRYLDGCAGLGGKTSHLVELSNQQNIEITAVEPGKKRSVTFHENFQRLHPDQNIHFFNGNLQEFAKNKPDLFDGILIDAPCSGTGVIGRNPDIRWNRKESELKTYQTNQLEILTCAASLLKPDGVLVYATCSLEPEENEQVVESFLNENNNFVLSNCRDFLPDTAKKLVKDGFFCPYPQETIDGFFAARLVVKR